MWEKTNPASQNLPSSPPQTCRREPKSWHGEPPESATVGKTWFCSLSLSLSLFLYPSLAPSLSHLSLSLSPLPPVPPLPPARTHSPVTSPSPPPGCPPAGPNSKAGNKQGIPYTKPSSSEHPPPHFNCDRPRCMQPRRPTLAKNRKAAMVPDPTSQIVISFCAQLVPTSRSPLAC